jgi:hypothetical protein
LQRPANDHAHTPPSHDHLISYTLYGMNVSCNGTHAYGTTRRFTQASSEFGLGRPRIEVIEAGETDVSDTGSMRLGFGVPGNSPAEAVILAQHAEALGFDQDCAW